MRKETATRVSALLLTLTTGVDAAEIKVMSTNALKAVLAELAPQFERTTEHKLVISFATSGSIAKRVADGETADLIISTSPGIDELVKQGKAISGSKVEVARSGIGVVVRKGAPKPDISTPEAFKQALLSAKTIAYTNPASGGASGIYFTKMLDQLGIAEQVKNKTKFGEGGPVAEIVARGEAEIGMQQIPELIRIAGVDYVGPLPGPLQHVTPFAAGVLTTAKQAEAAKALAKFLTAPAAQAVIKAKGMEPG